METRFIVDTDGYGLNEIEMSFTKHSVGDTKELFEAKMSVSSGESRHGDAVDCFHLQTCAQTTAQDRFNDFRSGFIPAIAWDGVEDGLIRHASRHELKNLTTFSEFPATDTQLGMKFGLHMRTIFCKQAGANTAGAVEQDIGRVDQRIGWLDRDVGLFNGSKRSLKTHADTIREIELS